MQNSQTHQHTHTYILNIYIHVYIYIHIYVCVLVGLRILHSYLIESSYACTQYEKIDTLKCKLQEQKIIIRSGLCMQPRVHATFQLFYSRFCWNPFGNVKERKKERKK